MEGKGEMWACWGIRQKGGMFKGSAKLQINEFKPLEVFSIAPHGDQIIFIKENKKNQDANSFLLHWLVREEKREKWLQEKKQVTWNLDYVILGGVSH